MKYRLTQKRRETLIAVALEQAKAIEGNARVRCLQADDVDALIDACQGQQVQAARVYADRGAFVPHSYNRGGRADITICETNWLGLPVVRRVDARRSRGNGPWVTINNRKVY